MSPTNFLCDTPGCEGSAGRGFDSTARSIEKMRRSWMFTDPVTGVTLKVSRTQLPLMPASACPLYSLQGMTCDPGLIAHFAMPRRADDDIKWLIVYVLLSRVRSLACLRSVGLTPKIRKIIEGGPPAILADNFEKLFRNKIMLTKQAASSAKAALRWHWLPQAPESASVHTVPTWRCRCRQIDAVKLSVREGAQIVRGGALRNAL